MRKILSLFVVCFLLVLVGCNVALPTTSTKKPTKPATTTTKTVEGSATTKKPTTTTKTVEGSTTTTKKPTTTTKTVEGSTTTTKKPTTTTKKPTTTTTTIPSYNVSFYDENGSLLETKSLLEGSSVSFVYNVNAKDDVEWDYTFLGWSLSLNGDKLESLPNATSDEEYYAVVSKIKKQYTITFEVNGGSSVDPITLDYGMTINTSIPTTKEGFKFAGWSSKSNLSDKIDFPYTVTGNATFYASWNEIVDLKAFLNQLLDGYLVTPLSFIEDSMIPGENNVVNAESINDDFSSYTNVSDMLQNGFGEQWQMVIENIYQSQSFYNILSIVETISASSVVAFNNYLDSNPADAASHGFKNGSYNVYINVNKDITQFVVDFTMTIPVLGEQSIQILLSMDNSTKERTVRIQVGDSNALIYKATENTYTFAIKYLGVRRALFDIERLEDKVVGHIYEFLDLDLAVIKSCAYFEIAEDYTKVVGNKANAFPGFTGYIVELYDTNSGNLIGFKKRETLSAVTYDTYGFDLSDYNGIDSIKYDSETKEFYVNGSETAFAPKKVGGISLKTLSRRFYIETSKEYYYTLEEDKYVSNELDVPILLFQQEYKNSLTSDISSTNTGLNVSLNVNSSLIAELDSIYEPMINHFSTTVSTVNEENIVLIIGNKVEFVIAE